MNAESAKSKHYEVQLNTDGSYSSSYKDRTSAGVIIRDGEVPLAAQRFVVYTPQLVAMNNVGGELLAASKGLFLSAQVIQALVFRDFGVVLGPTELKGTIRIFHDYVGVSELVSSNRPWKSAKAGTSAYIIAYQKFREAYPNVQVKFKKVKGHSGDYWNDLADAVANGISPVELRDVMIPEEIVK